MSALQRWGEAVPKWGIPQEILDQATESPWAYPVGLFAAKAAEVVELDTPSRRRALERLPDGGTVIDVGCGAGAASLPLAPPAAHITGVDSRGEMLAEFARLAAERRVAHREVLGSWPEDASQAGTADLVVCHHVLYNVPANLEPFVRALTGVARSRVVVEMTEEHPRAWQRALWKRFWNLERPTEPTAADAVEALREMGYKVESEQFEERVRSFDSDPAAWVAWVRRSLCLPVEREDEVALALKKNPMPRRLLRTIWWDGSA